MNNIDREMIYILNAAIRGKKVSSKSLKDIDLEKFIKRAREHSISGLLYSAIDWHYEVNENKELINDWKLSTFYTGVGQLNHINQVEKIIKKFNEENVRVIVLKGLVVREFYKNPELRTMSDADILVHEEDLDKARNILTSLGYSEKEGSDEHGAHLVFDHTNYLSVEVHWTLINGDYFSSGKEFEKDIWNNTMKIKLGDTEALSLGWEDLTLHLCIHMIVHMLYSGFGIRQLADLVILIEKKGKEINWDKFFEKSIECKADKFVIVIFNICKELFNMEIPFDIDNKYKIEKDFLDEFINQIIESGVYGRSDLSQNFANYISKSEEKNLKSFFRVLFPTVDGLVSKYDYAKKYRILLPVAWVHRLLFGVFTKKYSFLDKIKFITLTVKKSNNKTKMIKWLELK